MTRVALIHAVPMAMAPIAAAFRDHWPAAEITNLLDDALSVDRERAGALTPAIAARIAGLADYAKGYGADAILYTCSAFGDAIDAVARVSAMPVLKPNEAMFEAALARGRRIAMIATFEPSIAGMEAEFRLMAGHSGATIESICVPAAMAAIRAGDAATHDRLLAAAAKTLAGTHYDALLLAQFSMAGASAAVQSVITCPVLTSPASAVAKLKRAFSST